MADSFPILLFCVYDICVEKTGTEMKIDFSNVFKKFYKLRCIVFICKINVTLVLIFCNI